MPRQLTSSIALALAVVVVPACPIVPDATDDAGTPPTFDAGVFDSGPAAQDAGRLADAGGMLADAGEVVVDSGLPAPFDPGVTPLSALMPTPGEVSMLQLSLPAIVSGFSPPLGEAAILVGPDGTLALLDVGNVMHDEVVRDTIRWLNETALTPERGYVARAPLQVEWIVLTHFHSDHIGAFERLTLDATAPLVGVLGVIHRGFVGLGPAITENDFEEVCNALRGPLADVDIPLCVAEDAPPCDPNAFASTYPATSCGALPFELSLGAVAEKEATLTIVAASGHVTDGDTTTSLNFGVDDSSQENARSLAGILAFGEFRYHFGGDMTGVGDVNDPNVDNPDVESAFVDHAGDTFYGPRGVDVAHAHHHARRSSSNAALVETLAPADGRARNVVAGVSPAHVGSPHSEVLAAWAGSNRLSGGRFWVTHVTLGGASHPSLEDADGNIVTQTIQGGRGYWMQAVPNAAPPWALPFPSVRTLSP